MMAYGVVDDVLLFKIQFDLGTDKAQQYLVLRFKQRRKNVLYWTLAVLTYAISFLNI